MPNWCSNYIEIEDSGDDCDAEELQKFMEIVTEEEDGRAYCLVNLSPMPEVLNGTRSPKPTGDFDPHGKFMELVEDEGNTHWTPEHYEQEKAQHYMLIEKGDRAQAETGFDNWYDWANHPSNWGTKWGDCNTQLSFDPDYGIEGNFETAWGPLSAEFWEGVSKRFPTLKIAISYSEEGMCFEGGMAFHNGECLYDECTEMSAHMGQARMVLAQV
jgi:hypothetical protein